jgi:hypothetical protein
MNRTIALLFIVASILLEIGCVLTNSSPLPELVLSHAETLQEKVIDNWSIPEGSDSSLLTRVQVQLDDETNIVDIKIVEGSGSETFDASALKAVSDSEPFIELADLPKEELDKYFRTFNFEFNPEYKLICSPRPTRLRCTRE